MLKWFPKLTRQIVRGWLQGGLREHPKTHATHVVLEHSKNNSTLLSAGVRPLCCLLRQFPIKMLPTPIVPEVASPAMLANQCMI